MFANRTFNEASNYARDPANKGKQYLGSGRLGNQAGDASREVLKMIFPKVHALLDFAGARGTLQRDEHICRG